MGPNIELVIMYMYMYIYFFDIQVLNQAAT